MNDKKSSKLLDHEPIDNEKKAKLPDFTRALLVGIMIGVVAWSVVKNTIGLFTLIPLFFIYIMVSPSKLLK